MVEVAGIRQDLRLAGRVLRYHTWPHIRQQTVAEHSWQVARILLAIYPTARQELVSHCLFHDVGELRTGDPPYPIKADNPILKTEMDRLEGAAQEEILGEWFIPVPDITPEERAVFKLAEFIEMWEWGMEEHLLGSQFGEVVASRCMAVVQKRIGAALQGDDDQLHRETGLRAKSYVERRLRTWAR